MRKQWRPWLALTVLALTVALVALDLSDASVHRYWSRHSFTSSIFAGLLVLLLTLLVVDQVIRRRQIRDQSRAVGAEAAMILTQAVRANDAVENAKSGDDRDAASGELRTYTQFLLVSAPLLIESNRSRRFLELAQHHVALLYGALTRDTHGRPVPTKASLDEAVEHLRKAAAPLLEALNREQRAAVSSDDAASGPG